MVFSHLEQRQFLEAAREGGRLSHAYVFCGPEKIGKKTLALEWLGKILGVELKPNLAHPDFLFVGPPVDPKTNLPADEIAVDQIRGLIAKIFLAPAICPYKAAIIDQAHLMNAEAQNCLLKTLEEPPGKAILVLVAAGENRLLETIRSRAQIVKFGFVGDHELEKFGLDYAEKNNLKVTKEEIKDLISLSFGRPGRLADFLADSELAQKWRAAESEFARVVTADLPQKFAYAKKIADPETAVLDLADIIEIWQLYFRHQLLNHLKETKTEPSGVQPLSDLQGLNPRKLEEKFVFSVLKPEARQKNIYSLEKTTEILKKIHALSAILQTTNASPRLAIENFLLDL